MRAVTLDRVVPEGLAEEVALGQELQPKGQASATALRQPVLSTLAISTKAGTVSYCPLYLSSAWHGAHNSCSWCLLSEYTLFSQLVLGGGIAGRGKEEMRFLPAKGMCVFLNFLGPEG